MPFRLSPSVFHWRYSDRFATAVGWIGLTLSLAVILGLTDRVPLPLAMLVWASLWVLYLSVVNVGQTWYAFGWETLLLETGFLAVFLGNAATTPPFPLMIATSWLLFRVEFGAGLIKIRGDACWRDLTCLYYHHETQPMPNPLSWHFHHLPRPLHRLEVLGNHFAQLVVPFGLFLPQPVPTIAALVIIVTQSWLLLSGNFSWLNVITIVLATAALDRALLAPLIPVAVPAATELPLWYATIVAIVTGLIVVLSYRPARNLVSRRQLMNASFEPLHLVNTYGAFGSVTKERYEVVVEGTEDAVLTAQTAWREYEFKAKPGDVKRQPPQYAPFHLRLDWLMWFAAMSSPRYHEWFFPFMEKLLEADPDVLRLLRLDPFAGRRPRFVRSRLFLYRFTTPRERRDTGAWWTRTFEGEYTPPLTLRGAG